MTLFKTFPNLNTKKITFTAVLLLISVCLLSCQAVTPKKPQDENTGARSVVEYDPYTINMVIAANQPYKGDPYIATIRNTSGSSMILASIDVLGPSDVADNLVVELYGGNGCSTGKILKNNESCRIGARLDNMPVGLYDRNRILITFNRQVDGVTEDYEVVIAIRASSFLQNDKFHILTADKKEKVALDEDFGTVRIGDGKNNSKRYIVRNVTGEALNIVFSSSNQEVFKLAEVPNEVEEGQDYCKLTGQILENGADCYIGVKFYPRQAEPETSIVTVSTAAGEQLAVSLFKGRGELSKPSPIDGDVLTINPNYIKYEYKTIIGTKSTEEHSIKIQNVYKPISDNDPFKSGIPFTISHIEQNIFSFSGSCTTMTSIPAGGECTLNLTFRPLEIKKYSDPITISYKDNNGSYESVVVVFSEGRSADKLSDIEVSVAFSVDDDVPPAGEFKSIDNVSLPLTFDTIPVASVPRGSIYLKLKNTTGDRVFFKEEILGESFNSYSKSNMDNENICGGSIDPQGTCNIKIKTSPDKVGSNNGVYSINAGEGAYSITLFVDAVDVVPPSSIKLNKSAVHFFDTQLNITSTQTITVINTTASSQNLTFTFPPRGVFDSSTTCLPTLASRNSCKVTVVFRPNALGAVSSSLSIAGQTVPLTGTGVKPTKLDKRTIISTAEISNKNNYFGVSHVGATSEVFITTIKVTADTVFKVEEPGANFTYIKDFSSCIPVNNKLTMNLSGQASLSCNFAYAFTPTTSGILKGYLRLTNQSDNKVLEVELRGDAYYKPKSANFGYMFYGGYRSVDILYANEGQTPVNVNAVNLTVNMVDAAGVETDETATKNVTITNDACKGKMIEPGEICKISLKYQPTASDRRHISKVVLTLSDLTGAPTKKLNFMLLGSSKAYMLIPVNAWSDVKHRSSVGQSMTVYNGLAYSIGGSLNDKNKNNALMRYNPNTNEWSEVQGIGNEADSPYAGYDKLVADISNFDRPVDYNGSLRNSYLGVYDGKLLIAGGFLVSNLPYVNNSTTASVNKAFADHFNYGKMNLISLYSFDERLKPNGSWTSVLTTKELYANAATAPANKRVDRAYATTTMYGNNLLITNGYSSDFGAYVGGSKFTEASKTYTNPATENVIGYRLRDDNKKFTPLTTLDFAKNRLGASLTVMENLPFFLGGASGLPGSDNYAGGSIFGYFKPYIVEGNPFYSLSNAPTGMHSQSAAVLNRVDKKETELWVAHGTNNNKLIIFKPKFNVPGNPAATTVTGTWSSVDMGGVNIGTTEPTLFTYEDAIWVHAGEKMFVIFR